MAVKIPEIRTVTYTGTVSVDPNTSTTVFEKSLGLNEKLYIIELEIPNTADDIRIVLLRTLSGAEQELATFKTQFQPINFSVPYANIYTAYKDGENFINVPNFGAMGYPEVDFGQKVIIRASHSLTNSQNVNYKLKGILIIYR
jgi:hypothetical protein